MDLNKVVVDKCVECGVKIVKIGKVFVEVLDIVMLCLIILEIVEKVIYVENGVLEGL